MIEKILKLTNEAIEDKTRLYHLREFLLEELKKQSIPKAQKNLHIILEREIKKTIKNNPYRKYMQGAWLEDNKQYICNGYYLIELFEPINQLTHIKEDVKPLNAKKILSDFDDTISKHTVNNNDILYKYKIYKSEKSKDNKEPHSMFYQISNKYFNINYLKLMIDILGEAIAIEGDINITSPLLFEGKKGRMMILPVRTPNQNKESA